MWVRCTSHIERILESRDADLIIMSRPSIREPFLVKRLREGKTREPACISCNCDVLPPWLFFPLRQDTEQLAALKMGLC